MALRPRTNPDIPATSKPAGCHVLVDGQEKKCGKEAHHWLVLTIKVMDREVPVKKPVCDDHFEGLKDALSERDAGVQEKLPAPEDGS